MYLQPNPSCPSLRKFKADAGERNGCSFLSHLMWRPSLTDVLALRAVYEEQFNETLSVEEARGLLVVIAQCHIDLGQWEGDTQEEHA